MNVTVGTMLFLFFLSSDLYILMTQNCMAKYNNEFIFY